MNTLSFRYLRITVIPFYAAFVVIALLLAAGMVMLLCAVRAPRSEARQAAPQAAVK
ncbi:hypothetical protein [Paraburkholderia sacchari]|uniref:hypothetical protein n=1 Tax=Paraburkholderia sacchari TaxID=159450 RepID=UPI001BCD48F1|nr:hypothetical protein [Paraburkholderia sacchari]